MNEERVGDYMSLIYCPECGKQISDYAKTCPNCGRPLADDLVKEAAYTTEGSTGIENQSIDNNMGYPPPILGSNPSFAQNKPFYKKPWFWIIAVLLFIGIVGSANRKDNEEDGDGTTIGYSSSELSGKNYKDAETLLRGKGFTNITTEAKGDLIVGIISTEYEVAEVSVGGKTYFRKTAKFPTDTPIIIRYHSYPENEQDVVSKALNEIDEKVGTQKSNGTSAKTIGINEAFGNSTISAVITDVNLDYKDYNPYLVTVPKGYKAILITYKLTNISKSSNYVSVGDFNCYADNVLISPDIFGGTEYNANIDPGRAALLGGCYLIPENTESIEVQYSPIGEKAVKTIIKIK